MTHPSTPGKDLASFAAYAKKSNPGKLSYGTPDNGSSMQFAGESFKAGTGAFILHIPYRGAAPAINDVLGNQISMAIVGMPPVVPHAKSGKLRVLAVTTPKRSALMPDVPAVAEMPGMRDYRFSNWMGYVASQRSEGWIPVADDYDDPGFSGGNTDRPGLKRLMADIERGLIDIVVVYKIDRLTGSLADFSKMVEVFERQGVSFVSVTQQFNTTTSMGRLMLNVLLSFAQFEREVTGERIRDKIAASKRKGLWMGGVPPLGYDVSNRLLVINEVEAAVVRRIFSEMLTIGSPTRIANGLAGEGITTKAWTTQDGQMRNGTRMDRKYLYKLLRNRIYLGELSHKGSWFPGAHPSIIDHGLWGQVHEVLAKDPHVRSVETQTRSGTDALLRGLLFGPYGDPMYPTYAIKNGRKYRYYVSKSEMRFGAAGKTHERIPAAEVEAATVAQIKTVLSSPEAIAAVCKNVKANGGQVSEDATVMAMHRLGDIWEQLYPAERIRIVKLMIERVDLVPGGLKVKWRALGWKELIREFAAQSIGSELVEMEVLV